MLPVLMGPMGGLLLAKPSYYSFYRLMPEY